MESPNANITSNVVLIGDQEVLESDSSQKLVREMSQIAKGYSTSCQTRLKDQLSMSAQQTGQPVQHLRPGGL